MIFHYHTAGHVRQGGFRLPDTMKPTVRVTLITLLVNLALIVLKFAAGILGHSSALIADAVHSLSDAATDIGVLIGLAYAEKPIDKSHHYGHGKAETFATTIIGVVLLVTAGGIGVSAISRISLILHGESTSLPTWFALIAAAISIVANEAIYWYSIRVGKAHNCSALIANAWHHRSDSLSSVAALIGVGGAMLLGNRWAILDPIAAIATSLLIVWAALPLLRSSVDELMEKSLGEAFEKKILDLIETVDGARQPHQLRSRRIGRRIAIDVHLYVAATLTVLEAHRIADQVEQRLLEELGNDAIINIHLDPESQLEE